MNPLPLGIVTLGDTRTRGLAAAAERHPAVVPHRVRPEQPAAGDIAGLVVDVPATDRWKVLTTLVEHWHVPVLVDAPVAMTSAAVPALVGRRDAVPIFSENPLDHHLPTRRLRSEIAAKGDPLQQFFAAWRFRDGAWRDDAVIQLIDYLGHLTNSRPTRVTTMRRASPRVLLVSLRYADDVVGTVEVGAHLPTSLPQSSELLIECFCRDSVYHCASGNQAITVDGRQRISVDWSADPAAHMVSAFVEAVTHGQAPARSVDADLQTLRICDDILGAQ